MNNERREQLAVAVKLIEQVKDIIEEAKQAEEDAYENMPEGLQADIRGIKMEKNIDALDFAIDSADELLGYINTATEKL